MAEEGSTTTTMAAAGDGAQQTTTHHVYVGTFAHTPTPAAIEILHDTAVGVDADGVIRFVEPLPTNDPTHLAALLAQHDFPATTTTHARTTATAFYFPGLIDTHTHAAQYPNAGIFGNSTLLDWLDTYTFPLEASFSHLARARHIYRQAVARSLAHGTTCAAYYATVHVAATNLLADTCLGAGQRALIGRVCMDRLSPPGYRDASPAAAVAATEACIAHCETLDPAGAIVRPVITPRFAPACGAETLAALGALAQRTQHAVQTHISENEPEIALVRALFPEAPHYTGVYAAAGLLGARTILAHAVHLGEDEVAEVVRSGAGVAHCPASNTALTSGACPVRALLDAGVRVGLGTDVSGGYAPSVLEMVRQAMLVSRHVAMAQGERFKLNLSEALYLATCGGADIVGLGGKVGVFRPGFYFDAQRIQLNDYAFDEGAEVPVAAKDQRPCDVFGWEQWEDRIAKWVWCGDDRNVDQVWIGGRLVVGVDDAVAG